MVLVALAFPDRVRSASALEAFRGGTALSPAIVHFSPDDTLTFVEGVERAVAATIGRVRIPIVLIVDKRPEL